MGELSQLGAAGVLTLLIIREVFAFVKNKKGQTAGATEINKSISMMGEIQATIDSCYQCLRLSTPMTKDLHVWHDVDSPNHPGTKAWYSTEVEAILGRMAAAQSEQVELLRQVLQVIREGDRG